MEFMGIFLPVGQPQEEKERIISVVTHQRTTPITIYEVIRGQEYRYQIRNPYLVSYRHEHRLFEQGMIRHDLSPEEQFNATWGPEEPGER